MKLETERKEGKEAGKVETERGKWEGEREKDGDNNTDSIEAFGCDQLFIIRGSQANPGNPN